jgi:hypothetical protein
MPRRTIATPHHKVKVYHRIGKGLRFKRKSTQKLDFYFVHKEINGLKNCDFNAGTKKTGDYPFT